jgi:hypothetical protein
VDRNKWGNVAESVVVVAKKRFVAVLLCFRKIAYHEIFCFKINFGKLACESAVGGNQAKNSSIA